MRRSPTHLRRTLTSTVTALSLGLTLLVPSGPAAAELAQPSEIDWTACPDPLLALIPPEQHALYGCGALEVPLDHAEPNSDTIEIDIVRRSATDTDEKVGSLFGAFGGPGMSGALISGVVPHMFEPEVLARFDLIGINTRDTLLDCFSSPGEDAELRERMASVPVGEEEVDDAMDAYREYGEACAAGGGELLEHLNTRNSAHDLDMLREALGEDQLTYAGLSYGSLIGSTYAALYPERVRAMVLDSPVEPSARTLAPLSYDLQRAEGFEDALDNALDACSEAGEACSFSGGDPDEKIETIRETLREQSVELPDGRTATLESFTSLLTDTLGHSAIFGPLPFESTFAELEEIHTAITGEPAGATAADGTVEEGPAPADGPVQEEYTLSNPDAFYATNCADRAYPRTPGAVTHMADLWEIAHPTFGRAQAFEQFAACSNWQADTSGAYDGPWNAATEAPVMVLANRFDGPTPHSFAERTTDLLGEARLVSVEAFGHLALGTSACADAAVTDYLIDVRAPESGLSCMPDTQPFDG